MSSVPVRACAVAVFLAQLAPAFAQESARIVRGRRAVVASKSDDTTPAPQVFRLGSEGLTEVAESPRSLAALGVAPGAPATVVVPVEHLEPGQAAQFLASLPGGALWCNTAPDGRTILVSGRAETVDYALRVLSALDVPLPAEDETANDDAIPERAIGIIRVEHADVEELANLLGAFVGGQQPGTMRMRSSPQRAVPRAQAVRGEIRILADTRTSKLIVESSSPAELEEIRMLVRELDVDDAAPAPRATTRIVSLERVSAAETAARINELLGGSGRPGRPGRSGASAALVVPHEETNSLLLQGDSETIERIAKTVEMLDAVPPAAPSRGAAPVEPDTGDDRDDEDDEDDRDDEE